MKRYWWPIIFFILGILFRLWLVELVPQPLIFDQKEYHRLAKSFLTKDVLDLWISSYRTYGYPLILAAIYRFFGMENKWAWIILQALFDTSCAFFIYQIAKKIFPPQSDGPAWVAYILYLFNPLTSAYVGVRLTETTITFLITLIFFLFFLILEKRNSFYLFPLAFILGFLPFVRPGFLLFSIVTIGVVIYLSCKYILKGFLKGIILILMIVLFTYPFAYNIVRNLAFFKQFALLTVDNNFIKDFYLSLFVENQDTDPIPPEWTQIYQEYFTAADRKERQEIADRYLRLARQKIQQDPKLFIISRLKRAKYVWDKHFIFYYHDPMRSLLRPYVYWGNTLLLLTSLGGFFVFLKEVVVKQKMVKTTWFAILTAFLVLYISVLHTFFMVAGRFSLPAYPLVFLFAGYGLWRMGNLARVPFRKPIPHPKNHNKSTKRYT